MSSRVVRWFAGLVGGLVVLSLVSLLPIGAGRVSEAQYGPPADAQQQAIQIQQIQQLITRLLGGR